MRMLDGVRRRRTIATAVHTRTLPTSEWAQVYLTLFSVCLGSISQQSPGCTPECPGCTSHCSRVCLGSISQQWPRFTPECPGCTSHCSGCVSRVSSNSGPGVPRSVPDVQSAGCNSGCTSRWCTPGRCRGPCRRRSVRTLPLSEPPPSRRTPTAFSLLSTQIINNNYCRCSHNFVFLPAALCWWA